MTFEWPYMLLLAAFPAGLLWLSVKRGRGEAGPSLGLPHIRRGLVEGGRVTFGNGSPEMRRYRWRFWASLLLVIFALGRPQWGPAEDVAFTKSREIIVVLDVSRSMLAGDVAPSRLERARLLAARIAGVLPEQRIGLIAFAGSAHLVAPAADDRSLYQAFLRDLRPEHVLDQGTSFGALATVAAASFSPESSERQLLVLSDGEAEPGDWQAGLAELRARNIRVTAVGVGTARGALVPGGGNRPLLDERGNPVLSRLAPTLLTELASRTGGSYLGLPDALEVADRLRSGGGPEAGARGAGSGGRPADRFAWFLLIALLLLAWSGRTEWQAWPKLRRLNPQPVLAAAAFAALLIIGTAHPRLAIAGVDLHEEEDPLETVKEIVAGLLRKTNLSAQDYVAYVEAATRYGEVQRGLAQPLSEGVLEDALLAVARGRRLDPAAADWLAMSAKLKRLLVPPPPVPADGSDTPDPANERVDAERQVPVAERADQEQPNGSEKRDDAAGEAQRQSLRTVGGSRRDVYDEAEWQREGLAMPLYQLDRLRGTGTPAELFRLMQERAGNGAAEEGQVW